MGRNPDLYYRFSPELMAELPEKLVDCWIEEGTRLDPEKLLPSLIQLKTLHSGNYYEIDEGTPPSKEETFDPRAPHILQSIR